MDGPWAWLQHDDGGWSSCTPIPGGAQHELFRVAADDGRLGILKVARPRGPP